MVWVGLPAHRVGYERLSMQPPGGQGDAAAVVLDARVPLVPGDRDLLAPWSDRVLLQEDRGKELGGGKTSVRDPFSARRERPRGEVSKRIGPAEVESSTLLCAGVSSNLGSTQSDTVHERPASVERRCTRSPSSPARLQPQRRTVFGWVVSMASPETRQVEFRRARRDSRWRRRRVNAIAARDRQVGDHDVRGRPAARGLP